MSVPVLFLIFNRPNVTAEVFEAIRLAKPARLYIAADGPRDRPGEAELCNKARQIATNIDWDCELKTLFRERNLGCGASVSGALNWFFGDEEEGIILEDDCVPSPAFFPYCAELLAKFRDDERIMCISGANFQGGRRRTAYSYYFSRYMHCWGWACWRRAWQLYDAKMELWQECRSSNLLRAWGQSDDGFVEYWTSVFDRVAEGRIDTWDYQMTLTCWMNSGLTCLPKVNLVRNIGFGAEATHTHDVNAHFADLPAQTMEFPLVHPRIIARDVDADSYTHSIMRVVPAASTFHAQSACSAVGLVLNVIKENMKRLPLPANRKQSE
jgi:Glycosyl transferase family 2